MPRDHFAPVSLSAMRCYPTAARRKPAAAVCQIDVVGDHPFPDLLPLPWRPCSFPPVPWPRPLPTSVSDSCLAAWFRQELGSQSTVVVVCGGDVVVVDVGRGTAGLTTGADVAAVGSVGPLVAATAVASSVCWRRSSPPVNPIRKTRTQMAAAWRMDMRWRELVRARLTALNLTAIAGRNTPAVRHLASVDLQS
jgi:hypothetical protein